MTWRERLVEAVKRVGSDLPGVAMELRTVVYEMEQERKKDYFSRIADSLETIAKTQTALLQDIEESKLERKENRETAKRRDAAIEGYMKTFASLVNGVTGAPSPPLFDIVPAAGNPELCTCRPPLRFLREAGLPEVCPFHEKHPEAPRPQRARFMADGSCGECLAPADKKHEEGCPNAVN